jgi:peptidoglycan/xylan/chitin deacetylase (PgdA/CDA1 family)
MKKRKKTQQILASLSLASGYTSYLLKRLQEKAVVLIYHRVSTDTNTDSGFKMAIDLKNFEAQMHYIKENMTPLPIDELIRGCMGTAPLPNKAVAITFDDGYLDNYTLAYPLLKELDIPATIFITTGYMGSKKIFWWDRISESLNRTTALELDCGFLGEVSASVELPDGTITLNGSDEKYRASITITELIKKFPHDCINDAVTLLQHTLGVSDEELRFPSFLNWDHIIEMSNNGIDLGAHTVSHPDLTKLDIATAEKEVIDSKNELEEQTRKKITGFAYPFGLDAHINENVEAIVKRTGFNYACSAISGIASGNSGIYAIPRVAMPNTTLPLSILKLARRI